MSEVDLTEQLDHAIESLSGDPGALNPVVDREVADLLSLAGELRHLPRIEFKNQLRRELEAEMDKLIHAGRSKEKPGRSAVREGFRTVTPYLVVADVHEEIDFIKKVFGAEGKVSGLGSQGGYHSEFRIGDSMLMIGGGGKGSNWQGTPVPAVFHLYVEDVDGVYQKAMQAGAVSLMPPADMEYGERSAGVEDVSGNHWYIATATGPDYVPEGVPNLMPYFHPVGAPKMIEFLKEAFEAEEVGVYKSPDGTVQHAKIRIGNSIVEMGEAHGPWQPRPMHFMMYVDDADTWYERAMQAEGATSLGAPANQPYGGRTGTVKDPFGNVWYLSSQVPKEETESDRS